MSHLPSQRGRRVERHRRGVRDVERAEAARRRDPRHPVAELAGQLAQPRPLGAERQRQRPPGEGRRAPRRAVASAVAVEADDRRSPSRAGCPSRRRGSAPAGRAAARARPRRTWPAPRSPAPRAGAGATTARAPNTSAERRIAPTLCGSVTRSSSSTSGAPPRGRADLGHRAPVERLDLERRALVHRLRVERRVEAARVDDLGRHARRRRSRRASRSAALRVTTSRRRTRAGLASASRTACSPKSQTRRRLLPPLPLALDRPRRLASHAPPLPIAGGIARASRHSKRARGFELTRRLPCPNPAATRSGAQAPEASAEGWQSGQMQRTVNPSG